MLFVMVLFAIFENSSLVCAALIYLRYNAMNSTDASNDAALYLYFLTRMRSNIQLRSRTHRLDTHSELSYHLDILLYIEQLINDAYRLLAFIIPGYKCAFFLLFVFAIRYEYNFLSGM